MTIIIVRRAQKGSGRHAIVIIPSFQFQELSIPANILRDETRPCSYGTL